MVLNYPENWILLARIGGTSSSGRDVANSAWSLVRSRLLEIGDDVPNESRLSTDVNFHAKPVTKDVEKKYQLTRYLVAKYFGICFFVLLARAKSINRIWRLRVCTASKGKNGICQRCTTANVSSMYTYTQCVNSQQPCCDILQKLLTFYTASGLYIRTRTYSTAVEYATVDYLFCYCNRWYSDRWYCSNFT